ncbi:unnamed protein product [Heligmosomoides polygyrus]|uniref:7TM_GPCR_Srx domain-containing protein n=1 Tax=Heligmosomoides polygyrus TaxID=6339 RepID=A0A183GLJ5_HELPZ|nr:unnamed protein product [Heligmosomoides polygyrus]
MQRFGAGIRSGCWCASCLTCIFLALNRCADLSGNRYIKAVFEGRNVYLLMFISLLYLLFIMFFTTPASFNSNYISWFFNPMTGQESLSYVNFYHAINNVVVAISTTSLYFYLCIKLYLETSTSATKLGRFQKASCRSFCAFTMNGCLRSALRGRPSQE